MNVVIHAHQRKPCHSFDDLSNIPRERVLAPFRKCKTQHSGTMESIIPTINNNKLGLSFLFLLLLVQQAIPEAVAYIILACPSTSIGPFVRPDNGGPGNSFSITTKVSSRTRRGVSSSSFSSSDQSSTRAFTEDDEEVVLKLKAKKKTLYDILDSQPTYTRAELKQRYIALAKICHPDARRINGSAAADPNAKGEALDFSEIAAAWRILSDAKQRKRYDRSLRAEEISDNISAWVGDIAKQAAPVVEGFGNVANNFLRKTTATTLAGVQAAATRARSSSKSTEQVGVRTTTTTATTTTSNARNTAGKGASRSATSGKVVTTPGNSLSDTFKSAVDAAMLAGRKMDGLELLEKSEALEARALQESSLAAQTRRGLQAVMQRRLDMALHTPGSGLSAADALVILEDFNKTVADDLTAWDRAMLRHTIEYEIQELKTEEREFVKAQTADSKAQTTYRESVQAKFQAQQNLVNAEKAEIIARAAWEAAKDRLLDSKDKLSSSIQNLAQAESQVKKSDWEMEFRALTLERQAEKVRNALRHKQKQVRKELGLLDVIPTAVTMTSDNTQRLLELEQLRNEERLMAETSSRLELMAERLFERAHSLRQRAIELDGGGQG